MCLFGGAGISPLGRAGLHTMPTRGEGSRQNRQRTFLFTFFLSCLKLWILFHSFLWFSPIQRRPQVLITWLIPVQEWVAAAGVLPCPSPTARFSWPLWPWWGFVTENRRVKVPSKPPVTVKGCSSQRRGTMSTHTYTRVHWTCTQVGTFLERHPGVVMAPLRAKRQDVGTRVGPNTFCHNPQALIQVGVGSQWEGLPET